ncbi:hypothetical protein HAHE_18500 [Haloferula helveola]|uniref:TNase-like domain-containing protein n=1 Tax=Haloferula helveola TaxID=490095 RepID=A0ABM7RCZ7_9BACT|nr:hypothetical protein HAHE_18500 [Haloferula helveola]
MILRLTFVILSLAGFIRAEPLERIEGCSLVPTDWADGDSFLVRIPEGKEELTVRLYGVDCIETRASDDSDARRLRAQRRYFGISDHGGTPQASIDAAKAWGKKATVRTRELLAKPFTLHTARADARGDGKHARIYGFITTAEGKDLAAQLVTEGLARAYGVYRETPDGLSRDDWKEELADLEFQAANRRAGIWKLTDWDRLPEERRIERAEEAELKIAIDGAQAEQGSINPNTAARDELMKLPGIGEVTANRIIEGREDGKYQTAEDLQRVNGIGTKTLERITPFLTFE